MWGEAQGGRGGRPWSDLHAQRRRNSLESWQERLHLETLADLDGILPRVEQALRERQSHGLAGKTLQNDVEALKAFCRWCVKRGYLLVDPLAALVPFDITARTTRRALTGAEVRALLDAAPEHRRLLYEVALCSGLRAKELRSLSVADLDVERGGLHLRAEWTKNRKSGFQPLPGELLRRLILLSESRGALTLYGRYRKRNAGSKDVPNEPLLYVPQNTSRTFSIDRETAGIKKQTFSGTVDFHALRVTYVTFIFNARANVKEAQTLARHSTPHLTLNVYGRAEQDRLKELAEAVGEAVLPVQDCEAGRKSAQRKAVGAESYGSAGGYVVEAGGIEPPSRDIATWASTCVVCLLAATTRLPPLASADSDKQDSAPASSTRFLARRPSRNGFGPAC